MNKSQLVSKLMESIPYYIGNREEFDFSVHQMNNLNLENIGALKNINNTNNHLYHMVLLFCDGSHIHSFSWQFLHINHIKDAIKNAIYPGSKHAGLAVILMKDYKSTPDISVTVW